MVRGRKRVEHERRLPGPALLPILALERTQGTVTAYPDEIEHPIEERQAELAISLLRSLWLVAPQERAIPGIQGKEGIARVRSDDISVGLEHLPFAEDVDRLP